ncbi:glutathione S-transferase family protein [Henriciella pelagia]|jgi:glutathione S-transferase|nr:glutathione binding-like protein [Henriciella pelagia]
MRMMFAAGLGLALLGACVTPVTETEAVETMTEAQVAMPMPPLTIYHLEGRRSERIVWLMEELEMPYELEYVRGDLGASMAKVRALGHEMPMVPTVTLGDEILVESGAIIETIINRYAPGELTPPIASPDYAKHLMWLHYAEGSLAARLFSDYRAWMANPPKQRSPLVDSEAVVQYSENYLEAHDYFGGAEFSSADIMMWFPLNVATKLNLVDEAQFPKIAAWKTRVEARPAYQRMLEKARPDGIPGMLTPVPQRPPSERG